MRLQSLQEFQLEPGDFVCRERRVGRVATMIGFCALGGVFLLIAFFVDPSSRIVFLGSIGCTLFGLSFLPAVWRAWRTDPWVVCVRPSGIALNLRSCRNADRSAEDQVVAWLEWKEIRCAGESRTELRLPDPDNWRDRRHSEQHLMLDLTHARTEALEQAIRREFFTSTPTRLHYFAPMLELTTPSSIRVGWKDELHTLGPRMPDVLLAMTPFVPIGNPARSSIDWRELRPGELDLLLQERFRNGHHEHLVRLLRKLRGLSKKKAERLVQRMTTSETAGSAPQPAELELARV